MRYAESETNIGHVIAHTRNKFISVMRKPENFVKRAVRFIRKKMFGWKENIMREDVRIVVSEQIIEYPLVYRYLEPGDKKILDFGGFESILPLQLSALGHHVTVWDQRKYPFNHTNINVFHGDIFEDSVPRALFDVVISISTIEHLGLGRYCDSINEKPDIIAVRKLWSLVERNGKLLASVPAGKPATQRGYRVYNEKLIRDVFPDIVELEFFRKEGYEGQWRHADSKEIETVEYENPLGSMPCEAVAFIVCRKKN